MRVRYRLWGVVATAFCFGVFAGMVLPPIWLVIVEGAMIVFITFCWMCS